MNGAPDNALALVKKEEDSDDEVQWKNRGKLPEDEAIEDTLKLEEEMNQMFLELN